MMLQLHGKHPDNKCFPKKKTEVIWNIVKLCIDRSVRRYFSKSVDEVKNLEGMLSKLGELSWNTLKKSEANLVINKVDF